MMDRDNMTTTPSPISKSQEELESAYFQQNEACNDNDEESPHRSFPSHCATSSSNTFIYSSPMPTTTTATTTSSKCNGTKSNTGSIVIKMTPPTPPFAQIEKEDEEEDEAMTLNTGTHHTTSSNVPLTPNPHYPSAWSEEPSHSSSPDDETIYNHVQSSQKQLRFSSTPPTCSGASNATTAPQSPTYNGEDDDGYDDHHPTTTSTTNITATTTNTTMDINIHNKKHDIDKGGHLLYTDKSNEEEIEDLEQALKIQIEKRMEVEWQFMNQSTSNKTKKKKINSSSSSSKKVHSKKVQTKDKEKEVIIQCTKKYVLSSLFQQIEELIHTIHNDASTSTANELQAIVPTSCDVHQNDSGCVVDGISTFDSDDGDDNIRQPSFTINNNDNNNNQEQLQEFSELLHDFILELDGLDGDASEDTLERKDVLWFLKNELQWRFECIKRTCVEDLDKFQRFMIELVKILQSYENSSIVDNNEEEMQFAMLLQYVNEALNKCQKNCYEEGEVQNDINHEDLNATNHTTTLNEAENYYQYMKDQELTIARLEGKIVQLQEKMKVVPIPQSLDESIINHHIYDLHSMHDVNSIHVEYRKLLEKHKRLESRHRNIINDMQCSIRTKNDDILKLKDIVQEKESLIETLQLDVQEKSAALIETRNSLNGHNIAFDCVGKEDNGTSQKTPLKSQQLAEDKFDQQQQHQQYDDIPSKTPTTASNFCKSPHTPPSPLHTEIEMKLLREDIQERDAVILEMAEEIQSLKSMKMEPSHEADKVRLRYLEGIVKGLEQKLALANGTNRNAERYGSLAFVNDDNRNFFGSAYDDTDENPFFSSNDLPKT